ncbi:Uncharacterised protein [Vibrio cholerae]|nr:Uncharacterised protein [Vibrio cholerae]CSH93691.1 Uncharacterised protein [Vibrio cholerae]
MASTDSWQSDNGHPSRTGHWRCLVLLHARGSLAANVP